MEKASQRYGIGVWHDTVRNMRKALQITQQEAAKATGIQQSRISDIESGKVDPKLSEVAALSRFLDLTLLSIPTDFLPAVEFELLECEKREMRKTLPPTLPELILREASAS